MVQWPLRNAGLGLGVFLTGALAATAARVARKSAADPEKILFAILGGGLGLALVAFAQDNTRAAGKAFTYVYPYLILGVSLFPNYAGAFFQPRLAKLAVTGVVVWLGFQVGLGFYLPLSDRIVGFLGAPPKRENYDLSPIIEYLDDHPPRLLMVTVPRAGLWREANPPPWTQEDWTFALYSMFAFSQYPAYFQSGIILDNAIAAQNMWLQQMSGLPDYAVILKSVDYVGPEHLGTKVAETADLALYRITAGDLETFRREERRLFGERESESHCFVEVCVPPAP
jgi:hypothetical protein